MAAEAAAFMVVAAATAVDTGKTRVRQTIKRLQASMPAAVFLLSES
jgi:hypothetical protein